MKDMKIIFLMSLLCWTVNVSAQLKDSKGKTVNLSDFRGKIVIVDFWFTGCVNCMKFYQSSLINAEKHFRKNSKIVFVSVCIDKDKSKWLASLSKGRYASDESINLYTEGLGEKHPVIELFHVTAYPQPIIIGQNGQIISRSEQLTKPGELEKIIKSALKQSN